MGGMDLGGISEVAEILGVSRQRADVLSRYEGFPAPVGRLKGGRVWDLVQVRAWAKKDGRTV